MLGQICTASASEQIALDIRFSLCKIDLKDRSLCSVSTQEMPMTVMCPATFSSALQHDALDASSRLTQGQVILTEGRMLLLCRLFLVHNQHNCFCILHSAHRHAHAARDARRKGWLQNPGLVHAFGHLRCASVYAKHVKYCAFSVDEE